MHNVEFVDIKTFSFKNISLYIQLLLVFCILGCGIAFIFVENTDLLVNILYISDFYCLVYLAMSFLPSYSSTLDSYNSYERFPLI